LKILITGKNGQVGHELFRHLADTSHEIICVGTAECDASEPTAIRALIQTVKPDVLINLLAYTAVDRAESEPYLVQAINADTPEVIANEIKKLGGLLIHFSTDYVFDGQKTSPYTESDTPKPLSVYGLTKLQGDQAINQSNVDHIILRTSWVFGLHGNNFLKTMLRLATEQEVLRVVNDQFGAPTSARFLAQTVTQILGRLAPERHSNKETADRTALTGLYHCSCSGRTSWYDYAKFAIELARNHGVKLKLPADKLIPIPSSKYPTPAVRPANSVLDNTKLERTFGIQRPDWQTEVGQVIQALNLQP
jgi:dTDP-4-dehydrorhamnose reductase